MQTKTKKIDLGENGIPEKKVRRKSPTKPFHTLANPRTLVWKREVGIISLSAEVKKKKSTGQDRGEREVVRKGIKGGCEIWIWHGPIFNIAFIFIKPREIKNSNKLFIF